MAVTSGFFNGLNHDRRYNTEQLSRLFDGIIKDGIFSSIGTGLVVKAGTGNKVNVGIGKCWFNHVWVENDAIQPIDCDLSEVVLGRIDAIVIDIDNTETVRNGDIIYVKGTPASTPIKPTMISETNHHQYPLCYITRTANSSAITQADIENKVGSDETPFVTGILETMSLDQLLTQWQAVLDQFVVGEEADIMEWFESIKGHLTTEQATNLQMQIYDLQEAAGFFSKTTTFGDDDSVTETFTRGSSITTVFNDDGSITETHKDISGNIDRVKTTIFNDDGSVSESVITY